MNLYNRELITAEEALEKAQDTQVMREKLVAGGAKIAAV